MFRYILKTEEIFFYFEHNHYVSLIDVHTDSSTCNLSLHKENFEPGSMEHNQLMQYIQFWTIFECTLICLLCMFLHLMVLVLCPCCKVTLIPELSI